MGSRIFGSQSPNNCQYLVNGESDTKSARNKRDVKSNYLSDKYHQILCISNHYSYITISKKYTQKTKKSQYLKSGRFYQKSA